MMRRKPSVAMLAALRKIYTGFLKPRDVDGRALRGLEQRGWVTVGDGGWLQLTESGRKVFNALRNE